MTKTLVLPSYTSAVLTACTPQQLIDSLIRDNDRAPRNLIDECVSRGDAMIELLRGVHDFDPNNEADTGRWWLKFHAVTILGSIPSEPAGLLMVEHMRNMSVDEDENLQDWLAGYWPALFLSKPAGVMPALRTLADDQEYDWFIRHEAMNAYAALAQRESKAELEAALEWIAATASNEREDWDMRLMAGSFLLDFPRQKYRELLGQLARRQKRIGRVFGPEEVATAYLAGKDTPQWQAENWRDPWNFYLPEEIAERQKRWAEVEDVEAMADLTLPTVRDSPKIGRNDPCPCGSGQKYKKCCINK